MIDRLYPCGEEQGQRRLQGQPRIEDDGLRIISGWA